MILPSTRPEREQWGELRKFMVKVKTKYPTSQCFLKKTPLFVDNRSEDPQQQMRVENLFRHYS